MSALLYALAALALGVALGYGAGRLRRARRDVDAGRESERDALRSREGARQRFLATMSHEMRTPLNGVVGAIDLLRRTTLDRRQGELVEVAVASCVRLRDLLSDILDYTQLSTGELALEREALKLEQVVDDVVEELRPTARAKRVTLSVAHDPNLLTPVLGDHRRLRQLVRNLVENAIKFTSGDAPNPGRVSVSLRRDEVAALPGVLPVLIVVQDNGSGIDARTLSHVREPFLAGDMSPSRAHEGTGLGLAIVDRLADLMHGRIEIASSPLAGTTVRVHLALPMATADPITVLRPLDGRRYALRIADPELSTTVRRYLEHAGAAVLAPGEPDGDAALIGDARSVESADRALALVREGDAPPPGVTAVTAHPLRRAALIDALTRLEPGAAPRLAPIAPAADDTPGRPAEVLVVEDNLFNQRVIRLQLEQLGIVVEVAANGAAGLDAWQARNHPFILCDLHMPQMDGFEMVRRLRLDAHTTGQRPVIVAVSADALDSTPDACLRAGFDGFLAKPVQLDELRAVIARWQPNLLRRR